jgi:hypothetical protein
MNMKIMFVVKVISLYEDFKIMRTTHKFTIVKRGPDYHMTPQKHGHILFSGFFVCLI